MDELTSSHETLLKSVFQAMGLSRLEVVRDSAEFLEA
jgi:hypothetical protein